MGAARHVVLPQGLGAAPAKPGQHPHDAWHQFEGLVFVLVGVHVAAFAFWCWLLWASRKAKDAAAAAGGGGVGGAGGGAASRSTRDILRAYNKSIMGKG
ncbi:MAG: hypothetical protein J3K34DRAFT_465124 [Monoraphidium minutum]|nr:MAG: hypothetical protein J3K34DRAFT_465124 [Monoraphidium minutum]